MKNWVIGLLGFCIPMGGIASAVERFSDDFSNPDPTASDRQPVTWRAEFGAVTVENGDLLLTRSNRSAAAVVSRLDFNAPDVRIESQFRVRQGTAAGLFGRYRNPSSCYFGSLNSTEASLFRCDGDTGTRIGGPASVDFDVMQVDAEMRLEIIGDEMSLWAWPAGTTRPTTPLVTATDTTFAGEAIAPVAVFIGNSGADTEGVFRHVVAEAIPEPSTAVLGMLGAVFLVSWQRNLRL